MRQPGTRRTERPAGRTVGLQRGRWQADPWCRLRSESLKRMAPSSYENEQHLRHVYTHRCDWRWSLVHDDRQIYTRGAASACFVLVY